MYCLAASGHLRLSCGREGRQLDAGCDRTKHPVVTGRFLNSSAIKLTLVITHTHKTTRHSNNEPELLVLQVGSLLRIRVLMILSMLRTISCWGCWN